MIGNYIATIIHHKIETSLIISSDSPLLLIVENPHEFYSVVYELKRQFCGEDGDYILLQNEERLDFDKLGEMICDIFSLDFGDRKISSALNKNLEKAATDGELILLRNELNTHIAEYYYELFEKISLPLTFDSAEITDILKIGKIRLQNSYDSLIEKLICYINTMIQLKGSKIFVFVNLKSVLSDEELSQLYKHCRTEKVGLLLIESNGNRKKHGVERSIVITEDLCEIVDNDDII